MESSQLLRKTLEILHDVAATFLSRLFSHFYVSTHAPPTAVVHWPYWDTYVCYLSFLKLFILLELAQIPFLLEAFCHEFRW